MFHDDFQYVQYVVFTRVRISVVFLKSAEIDSACGSDCIAVVGGGAGGELVSP